LRNHACGFHQAVVLAAYRNKLKTKISSQQEKESAMLSTVIYLLAALRRALRKSGRGLFMIAEVFAEALEQSHAARRKYPFAE
jgi:hypothetical protein